MKRTLLSFLGVAAVATACTSTVNGTNDPNTNGGGGGSNESPGTNGNPGNPPDPKAPPGPGTCAAPPAPGVDKPVELTADVDFHPVGAFVDSQHRAMVYGWSTPAPISDATSLFVARFAPDGTVDTSFGKRGLAVIDSLDDVNGVPQGVAATVDASDRIVLTWLRTRRPGAATGERVLSVARITAQGALDTGFGQGGFVEAVPLGLGPSAPNPNNPGEIGSTSIKQDVNTAVATLGAGEVFAFTTVNVTKTSFGNNTIETTDFVRGVHLGPTGAKDPSYAFERKRASFGLIGASAFGNFVYLWASSQGLKLDAKGTTAPSFALEAPPGPATVAMRSDGTLLATDYKEIYTVGPDGKRQTTLTDHGGRFTVRCDGRLVVANGSSTQIEASLLLPNGELDTSRGTGGVVTYKPSDQLATTILATVLDPSSGSVTQFYVRSARSAPDTLVAVRLHP